MKFDQLRNELSNMLLEVPQYEVQGSLEAVDICAGFEKNARRVPRNICADPSVEAKNAVSKIFRSGMKPLAQSMKNCVREADDAYLLDYVKAVEILFRDYLAIDLLADIRQTKSARELSVVIKLDEKTVLSLCAEGALRGNSTLKASLKQAGIERIVEDTELSSSFLRD